MKVIILILFLINSVYAGVIENINIEGESGGVKDFGEYLTSDGFYLNPALAGFTKKKLNLKAGYLNLYSSQFGFNLFHFTGSTAKFPYINSGLYIAYFTDSDEVVKYSELRTGLSISPSKILSNPVTGININFTSLNLSVNSEDELITGNSFKQTKIDFDIGIIYLLKQYNLIFSFALKNITPSKNITEEIYYLAGIGYKVSDCSKVGLSFRYRKEIFEAYLGTYTEIIPAKVYLLLSVSFNEYTGGLKFRVYKTEKIETYINYTISYNLELKETHYISASFKMR